MTHVQRNIKRLFDLLVSFLLLFFFWWLILVCWIIATLDTRRNGFFTQERIGYNGNSFKLIKFRSMRDIKGVKTNVTTGIDPRITFIGRYLRKTKLDELPQLFNVLIGKMSIVGPRPDVPGFADKLRGNDRVIIKLKPGITGPASLYFRHEEELLKSHTDPEKYNYEILWPEKVKINKQYYYNYTFWKDIYFIIVTIIPWLKVDYWKLLSYQPEGTEQSLKQDSSRCVQS